MPIEPLTAREWYLVCAIRAHTLLCVLAECNKTGLPGRVAAQNLFNDGPPADLRAEAVQLLKEFPGYQKEQKGADPR